MIDNQIRNRVLQFLVLFLAVGCGSPTEPSQVPDLAGTYSFVPVAVSPADPEQAYLSGSMEITDVRDSGEFSGQTNALQICGTHREGCSTFVPSPGVVGQVAEDGEIEAALLAFGRPVVELSGSFQDGALRGSWASTVTEGQAGLFAALRQ